MSRETNARTILRDAKAVQEDAIDRAVDAIASVQREAGSVSRVVQQSASDIAAEVTRKLREAGIDTDQLLITARDQAGDLQKMIVDEVRSRPVRALGFAALAGVVVGLLSTR